MRLALLKGMKSEASRSALEGGSRSADHSFVGRDLHGFDLAQGLASRRSPEALLCHSRVLLPDGNIYGTGPQCHALHTRFSNIRV
jgi:hypothetical protein